MKSKNMLYDLEDIREKMKKEFGNDVIRNDELTFESLYIDLENTYKQIDLEHVKASKVECQISLSEMEDNTKSDSSIAYMALIASFFASAVAAIKDINPYIEITILFGIWVVILLLIINDIKKNSERKRLKLERQYLKFKLFCIDQYCIKTYH